VNTKEILEKQKELIQLVEELSAKTIKEATVNNQTTENET